jgi:hypothetical protein
MASSDRTGQERIVPQPIASLIVLHGRTQLLREECDAAVIAYASEQAEEGASLLTPAGFRLWTFLCLWLAYLYVLVEGYREAYKHRYPLADPAIDGLLLSSYTDKLRRFRNKIFHPEMVNHEAISTMFEDQENVRLWAGQLTDEFRGYLLAYAKMT